ncbi:MAG: class I SAM-dependent DNA methyltransferase [Eubacterium sp.]|nr:class I SAM-dependent DNA methyltransferase [Eubacterium sp.]
MARTEQEIKKAAKEFSQYWKGKGYEKGESQVFWVELLSNVFGVENATHCIEFEEQVHIDKSTGFIDAYIPDTKVLIEQKSVDKDLRKPIRQSDGTKLNPFQQAKKYITELPLSRHPKWVITCNFKEFLIYDMENPNGEPESILLENLPKEYYRLNFLVDTKDENIKREEEISIQAGEIVGKLYDALSKQYVNPDDEHSQKSLNVLCVRLVFCFYAEDSGVFGKHLMFHDYLKDFDTRHFRSALIDVFRVLNTKIEDRDPYMDDELAAFPYVNGGLFADDNIEIPQFTDEIIKLILENASADFDWSEISPTIFGAVFESTLNPETRRSGGMHYTSVENIHKVIDPLFLDDLKAELEEIKELKQLKTRNNRLDEFCNKLSGLKFLDPACGSGNFLTETYISLRKLENEAIALIHQDQILLGTYENPIKVKIDQFYGIEINDFAVTVAKTALWIAESQMMKQTEDIVHTNIDFLPLTTNAYIVEGNALRIDWNDVVPASELNYIMGNPPFVGTKYQSSEQKEDILNLCQNLKMLDYVTGWYYKADEYMRETDIITAFVSTNSITQGEQVGPLWSVLDSNIVFAHKSFRWDSEANAKAHVHCVIIGLSHKTVNTKRIYEKDNYKNVDNINGYLIDAPSILITSKSKPICKYAPRMIKGSQPTDGGYLLLNEEERNNLIADYPLLDKYIKRYMGAQDLINNNVRYCLWLKDASPNEYRRIPQIVERLEGVRNSRLTSKKVATQKWADRPYLFTEDRQPNSDYLILPVVSSERRRYMPVCYVSKDVVANANAQMIPNADLFSFGVLNSNVHNAWMRAVCGRLETRYAYSATIVYNNFPWCNPTDEQRAKIEQTAQSILDARAKYPDCSLADLYDELTMPPELRKAHQDNDRAVMEAYGFSTKMTESECVAELMKMYQKHTEK